MIVFCIILVIIFLFIWTGVYALVSILLSNLERKEVEYHLGVYRSLLVMMIHSKISQGREMPLDSSDVFYMSEDISLAQNIKKPISPFFRWIVKKHKVDLGSDSILIRQWVSDQLANSHSINQSFFELKQLRDDVIKGRYDEFIKKEWVNIPEQKERMKRSLMSEIKINTNNVFLEYKANDMLNAVSVCQQKLNKLFLKSSSDIVVNMEEVCDVYEMNLATPKDAENLRARIILILKEYQFILLPESTPFASPRVFSICILIVPSNQPQKTSIKVTLTYPLMIVGLPSQVRKAG